jgi:hypothetical protein
MEGDEMALCTFHSEKSRLPIKDDQGIMTRRHSPQALDLFFFEHMDLFDRNPTLLALPPLSAEEARASVVCLGPLKKVVYLVEGYAYIFLSDSDHDILAAVDERTQNQMMRPYCGKHPSGFIFEIIRPVKQEEAEPLVNTAGDGDKKMTIYQAFEPEEKKLVVKKSQPKGEIEKQNNELKIACKVLEKELQYQKREHDQQLLILHQQFHIEKQEFELQMYRQFTSLQETFSGLRTLQAPEAPPRISTPEQWLGGNLYGQDFSKHQWGTLQPWAGVELAQQTLIMPPMLEKAGSYRNQRLVRFSVPFTASFLLRSLMDAFVDYVSIEVLQFLRQACPIGYALVLLSTMTGDKAVDDEHRTINADNLALHLNIIAASFSINEKETKHVIQLCKRPPRHQALCLDLLAAYYPHPVHFGHLTLLSFNMGVFAKLVKKQKNTGEVTTTTTATTTSNNNNKRKRSKVEDEETGEGQRTGGNKNCPFCKVRERVTKQANKWQSDHQPTTCPTLALLGNNEADVLLLIRDTLNGALPADLLKQQSLQEEKKKPKEGKRSRHEESIRHHGFLFGKDLSGSSKAMALGPATLLRHATEDEIRFGQHVNGLRINRPVYKRLRQAVYRAMRQQLNDNQLFDKLDKRVVAFVACFADLKRKNGGEPVEGRLLLHAADGQGFLASRFDADGVKPLREFEQGDDGLYFSLVAHDLSSHWLKYFDFVNREKLLRAPPPLEQEEEMYLL